MHIAQSDAYATADTPLSLCKRWPDVNYMVKIRMIYGLNPSKSSS